MAEDITTRIKTCGQCGKGYEWRYGATLYRGCCSQQCATKRNTQKVARWVKANRRPRICIGCGVEVGKRRKRCEPCHKVHYRAYHRSLYEAAPKWRREAGTCVRCASGFVPHVPHQRYCSTTCRSKAHSRRPSETRPLYNLARWRKIRRARLVGEPRCRFCALAGLETTATVCDHVVPHRGDVDAFWAGPFQSLCTECHNRDKQRMECRAA